MALLELAPSGFRCESGGFVVDPWEPVDLALVTHAHPDRVRAGCGRYMCTSASVPLVRNLLGEGPEIRGVEYGETIALGRVSVSFHPSGHVLGSAQVRIESAGKDGVAVFSGDWKREPDPTCEPFEVVRCDTFFTEAAFALPIFRWPDPASVVREILAWRDSCAASGRAAVLLVDDATKAARVLGLLAPLTDRKARVARELVPLLEVYARAGKVLLATETLPERPRASSLRGELVLAPLASADAILEHAGKHETALVSGWARIRGARRRGALDRGFVVSDHADWPALTRTIEETGARRVFATHDHAATLARFLKERGVEAFALETPYRGETVHAREVSP